MKSSTSTTGSIPTELEITVIKKSKDIYSQEVKMKLPSDTNFECVVEFMVEQGFLKGKDVIIRPAENRKYVIGLGRKILECYNLIKLKFVVEEVEEDK